MNKKRVWKAAAIALSLSVRWRARKLGAAACGVGGTGGDGAGTTALARKFLEGRWLESAVIMPPAESRSR
jgi:hypothetical protein